MSWRQRAGQALGIRTLSEAPPEGGPVGDYSANVQPPDRRDAVTLERVVGVPAAYRAVQIIGSLGSQLTISAVRGGQDVTDLQPLVRQPDPWRSLGSFIQRGLVGLAADGNGFILKHRGADGAVAALEFANPRQTFVRWDKRGGRWVKSYDVAGRDGTRTWAAKDVEHIWLLEVPGFDRGLGPIAACRYAIEGHLDVRDYADSWFHNPDEPSGVLSTDQMLDPAQAREYRRVWRDPNADLEEADKRYGPQVRILGKGLKYEHIALKPEDAQWLEAQNFGVLDFCRMFGMPEQYLSGSLEGSNLTYTNWQQVDMRFLRTTLFPLYLRPLQDAITACLPRGQEAVFNTDRIERPDAQTRAVIDTMYLPHGIGTPAEIAKRENRALGTPQAAPAPTPIPAP
jgi:HK97 family phage portal protein